MERRFFFQSVTRSLRVGIMAICVLLASCSINRTAMKMVAGALSSGTVGSSFTGDDDPELVGDALPFVLKLYESLLDTVKDNPDLYLTAGSGFIMYANAYVQMPADMLPEEAFEQKKQMNERARRLYLRGRDYVLQGIEVKYPGFKNAINAGGAESFFARMNKTDVPYLYWTAAGWMAAWAANPFDVETGIGVKKAAMMMEKALSLDEAWDEGAIHEFFILYYGSLPESMGGSVEKARHHFERALALSKGKRASPYVSLASTVSVKNQNAVEFADLLNKALSIDVSEKYPGRLVNIIAQRKARLLLERKSSLFLEH